MAMRVYLNVCYENSRTEGNITFLGQQGALALSYRNNPRPLELFRSVDNAV